MTLQTAIGIALACVGGFILAVVALIALCCISGGYSEQDCEDYLRARLDYVDEFAETISKGRE
jgi:hypothetical protein